MDDRGWSRRDALRGLTASAATVGVAGCLDSLPLVGGGSIPSLGPVPDEATVVATADVETLLNDEGLRELVSDVIPITDLDSAVGSARDAYGLDPAGVRTVIGFGTVGETPRFEMLGGIVTADWTPAAVERAVENQSLPVSTRSIGERTIFDLGATGISIGVIEDGRYVAGRGGAVEAVFAVEAGDRATVGAGLRRAYGWTRGGPIRAAVDPRKMQTALQSTIAREANLVSEDIISGLRFVTGSLYRTESQYSVDVDLRTTDDTAASNVVEVAEAIPYIAGTWVDDEAVEEALEEVTVSREDTTITMRYRGTAEAFDPFVDLARRQLSLLLLGFYDDLTG